MRTFEHDGVTIFHGGSLRSYMSVTLQKGSTRIDVPVQALVEFVASLVRDEKIRQLEQADAGQILGVGTIEVE